MHRSEPKGTHRRALSLRFLLLRLQPPELVLGLNFGLRRAIDAIDAVRGGLDVDLGDHDEWTGKFAVTVRGRKAWEGIPISGKRTVLVRLSDLTLMLAGNWSSKVIAWR